MIDSEWKKMNEDMMKIEYALVKLKSKFLSKKVKEAIEGVLLKKELKRVKLINNKN